jgi:hypothetical protein
MTPLQIRPMTRAELGAGLDWAAGEGWNPGVHDADGFHAADPCSGCSTRRRCR